MREGAFLGLLILVGRDETPVDVFHLIDGVEKLLAEGGVGDAAVVLGLQDEAAVHAGAEALQQVLRGLRPEAGGQGRAVVRTLAVGGLVRVVEGDAEERSGEEALLVAEVVGRGIVLQRVGSGEQGGGLLGPGGFVGHVAGKHRIEHFRKRTAAVGAEHEARCAGAAAAGGAGGAAGSAAAGDGGRGAAERVGDEAGRDAAQGGTGLGAQDVSVGDVEVNARDRDVEVIFEREQHRIRQAQIDLAIADQLVQFGRIAQARERDVGGSVRLDRVGEHRLRMRVIDAGVAEVERLGHLRSRSRRKICLSGRDGLLRRWRRRVCLLR